jgi:hypothetical protein
MVKRKLNRGAAGGEDCAASVAAVVTEVVSVNELHGQSVQLSRGLNGRRVRVTDRCDANRCIGIRWNPGRHEQDHWVSLPVDFECGSE